MSRWRPASYKEVLARSGGAPILRQVAAPDAFAGAVTDDAWAALFPWRPGRRFWGGYVHGADGADAGAALDVVAAEANRLGAEAEWWSVDEGRTLETAPGWATSGGGDWAYLWTESCHDGHPVDVDVVELDDERDAAEIESFGFGANPRFEGHAGAGHARLWLGLREEGRLRAVGAVHRVGRDTAHLAGIVVDPSLRGRGVGRALTAELTRRSIARDGVCTLSVYSDNATAIALYHGLGYQTAHRFHTVSVARVPT